MTNESLQTVLGMIDEANARDPDRVGEGANGRAAALVYGERMSEMLEQFDPAADELLRIAVRAQHIERWTVPRASYPQGRVGYLKWRTDLKAFHARRAADLMRAAGYDEESRGRVAALIRKEALKRDPQAQALEDVACLVFLNHYADAFIADHEDGKVADILAKTVRKMSPLGVAAAAGLPLPERLGRLLASAVGRAPPA